MDRIVLKCQWKVLLFLAELSLSLATKLHFSLELSDLAWCCFMQLKAQPLSLQSCGDVLLVYFVPQDRS